MRQDETMRRNLNHQRELNRLYRDEMQLKQNESSKIMASLETFYQTQLDLLKEKLNEKRDRDFRERSIKQETSKRTLRSCRETNQGGKKKTGRSFESKA